MVTILCLYRPKYSLYEDIYSYSLGKKEMERVKLRIRIPEIYPCLTPDCTEVSRRLYCKDCLSDAGVREEMSPATLTRKIKIVHSSPLGRNGSCLGKVH
jgi:hypothetical protein